MKRKHSLLRRTFTMIIAIPIVIFIILITLLYIPAVQRAVVRKACTEIGTRSGYKVEIGAIALTFPLKLKATDYRMSRNDTIYFQGRHFDANISLLPLFAGKVEINYASLEELDIHTHNLLPELKIDGKVGYARLVARDADLVNKIADIRQLRIADTAIDIALTDTTTNEQSEPLQWVMNLRKGDIINSCVALSVPHDTLKATFYVDRLQVNQGRVDIPEMTFAMKSFALRNSGIEYDKGGRSAKQAPLEHIRLEKININAKDLRYASLDDITANITALSLEQPGGIAISRTRAHFTSDRHTFRIHGLEIDSRNGSHIYGQGSLLQKGEPNREGGDDLSATLLANINRRDLARLVAADVYNDMQFFNEQLLNTEVALSGNIHDISIDTFYVESPGIGFVNVKGHIQNVLDETERSGEIAFKGKVDNIGLFTGHNNDSIDGRVEAEGKMRYAHGKVDADIALHSANGKITGYGSYSIEDTAYDAHIRTERLALSGIMPGLPLHNLTMELSAKGDGTDIFSDRVHYDADINVDTLYYADYRLHSLKAKASQAGKISSIGIEGEEKNFMFNIEARTVLDTTGIENSTAIELANADFKELGFVDSTLRLSADIDIAIRTDLKETHSLKVNGKSINIVTKTNSFKPQNLAIDFATSPFNTSINILNGDLKVDGNMDCGYNKLFAVMQEIGRMNKEVMSGQRTLYHLHDYEQVLPSISLAFDCGRKNVLHNFLAFTGVETENIRIDADISQSKGLNIKGDVSRFRAGEIGLDSIRFATRQNGDRLDYIMGATDLIIASIDEENCQKALLYGSIKCDTITSNLILRDKVKKIDSRAGLTAVISPGNMNIHFTPEAMVFGTPFTFNKGNYINIGKAMSIDADVTFKGSDDNGFHLYSTPDRNDRYNLSLDIFNINIEDAAKALPAVPEFGGTLSARLNYRQDNKGDTFTCNADIENLSYESDTIGNERVEIAYSPKSNDTHRIHCTLRHNKRVVARIESDYRDGALDGSASLNRLPLEITQAFIDKEGVVLDGYVNSSLRFKGTLTDMDSYGYLQFDSTYAYSPMLGATLHPAEEKVMIENSILKLQGFHIYDKANTPFVINGNVDITNLLNPRLALNLNASNYEILNTPRKAGNMVYGKMYVDLRSMIRGTADDIRLIGSLTVLNNSNFAYVIPETAFDSNKELDGLVEFVDFNDTTYVRQQEPASINLGDITANLNIIVQEGAKLSLDFDSSRENYVSIDGDANLNATYDTNSGFNVTGIYKLNSGQVKLTLPIIPLKTFYIQEGSRLTWTGDLFNPILDVTALEKTTVSVEMDDNSIQPVVFNTGVIVSNSINDLAIDFTMSSPENAIIQNELNALDQETLNKYAVAMIITGTYLGGKQGVTASSALSSFLDAKINEISGSAIKNLDVNIGINDAMNAETGSSYKNYSFSFSKRFFNDRITVVIGGEVNSGDRPDKSTGNNTFINNVSLEWKLNDSGNRYIRIFYDKNYQSLLEGEITETGVGYVYKRKLNNLKELFDFKRKKKKNTLPQPQRTIISQR